MIPLIRIASQNLKSSSTRPKKCLRSIPILISMKKLVLWKVGLKAKEVEKVYGITPTDYHIFAALGRIDNHGNQ